jgi:beta-glucosidase/6-phospho-beta-glucosidase/beta-galactosidase
MFNPFTSFWMAGFECTDQLNAFGNRVDFLQLTGHLDRLDEDYKKLGLFHIKTVREGIRWSQVETAPYTYNWETVGYMIEKAKAHHIQQVWDLCHFGFPGDLTPLHPHFSGRFVALCESFIHFYRSKVPVGPLIVTPVNEVSFLSWLGGDVAGTAPYCKNNGWEVKYALMRAYIKSIEAMKRIDGTIRILTTEPLVNMVPPLNATEAQLAFAVQQHEQQFQVLEMLSGNICPELGGQPAYLDLLGFNYYYNNQWIAGTGEFLPWQNEIPDSRWKPLRALLQDAYQRYQRPLVLSETSHPLEDRPLWIEFIAKECAAVLHNNIPLLGICWYPIIDRPDWDHLDCWHQSGLWDLLDVPSSTARSLHQATATAVLQAQRLLQHTLLSEKVELK